MQGASPLASPTSNCLRHVQSLPYRCLRGACLLGRLPPLPLACFAAPIPPTPFPSGEGGDSKFILPGAAAPGAPALDRLRHWLSLPYRRCTCGGGLAPISPARRALAAPCRERLFLPPAAPPSLPLLSALSPPRRAQAGRTGEPRTPPSPARKKSPAAYTAGLLRQKARITSRWRST